MSEEEWEESYNYMVEKHEEIIGNLMARIRRESQYEIKFYIQLENGYTLFHEPSDYYEDAQNKIFEMGFTGAKVVSRKESPLQEVHVSTKEDQE